MPVADFPSIEPNAVAVLPVIPLQINRTLSGRETRDLVTGPYFEFTYEFEALSVEQRKQIAGHIALANGGLQSFYVKIPTHLDDASGNATGTIDVATGASAGATSVDYTAASATDTTVFKSGDMIQFDNHGKIYEVTADSATTGASGTVNFFPPLRTAITTSEDINYDNVPVLVRYKDDLSYEVRNDSFGYITLQFLEVFE
jgi:hypothetical protein